MTEYWHPNASDGDMEAAWDAIETNPLAIALDNSFAKRVKLEPSTQFPWDTERSIYYVKGIHDLHCLVRRLDITLIVSWLIRSLEIDPQSHCLKTP